MALPMPCPECAWRERRIRASGSGVLACYPAVPVPWAWRLLHPPMGGTGFSPLDQVACWALLVMPMECSTLAGHSHTTSGTEPTRGLKHLTLGRCGAMGGTLARRARAGHL